MATGDGTRSFEEILTAVEQDERLRDGAASGEKSEAAAGEGGAPLGGIPPELISKLPLILRAVNCMAAPMPHDGGRPKTPEGLLCALRPYLNERRRQAIDAMIRISRLGGSLGLLH